MTLTIRHFLPKPQTNLFSHTQNWRPFVGSGFDEIRELLPIVVMFNGAPAHAQPKMHLLKTDVFGTVRPLSSGSPPVSQLRRQ
jgi:hypothetical protein